MSQHDLSLKPEESQEFRELFNRSPHPYHRRSFETSERISLNRSLRPNALQLDAQQQQTLRRSSPGASLRSNTSPSDSGTEADDEKPLLRALTAPPLRPRKGLKGLSTPDDIASPLLTPSGLHEDKSRLLAGHAALERRKSRTKETINVKQTRRPRRYGLEVIRRLSEASLFIVVAWISVQQNGQQAVKDLVRHTIIVSITYVLYFPQLILKQSPKNDGRNSLGIRFPASADPAPLLYPVFLPLLVNYSVGSEAQDMLIAYVLSFCAIPRQAIPFGDMNIQWLITLVPLMLDAFKKEAAGSGISLEEVVLLYPLHCALMQVLYFLTTTSLLTTELQLLSISLINLLGVPKTPQSSILKALMWVGGLAMLVTCRHVLKLSVELARIPSWRLRRVYRPWKNASTVYYAVDDTLGGFLSRRLFPLQNSNSSDEEEARQNLQRRRTVPKRNQPHQSPAVARMTVDDLQYSRNSPAFTTDRQFFTEGMRQRRHTLPGTLASLPDIPTITRTATDALSSARTRSKLILRLTLPQATVLKWLYAAFVYLMTILIILVPVRLYVQHLALNGEEPIGWALGYLFGDQQAFRMQVIMANLDSWICLPSRDYSDVLASNTIEYVRQRVIGAANTRLLISAYCLIWISMGIALVLYLSNIVEVDTRRKVFHGMMVVMFLPTIFVDPTFIALAFTIILAIFLLLDLFRASQLPPLSKPLTYFLAPYVDGRDHKGPIVISHIFLLIGCAIPLWLSLAAVERSGTDAFMGWEVPTRDLSMVTGVICVGMGDAAASLIGRRFGRRRWPWSGGKSLEGSAAFAFAVFVGLTLSRIWLVAGGWSEDAGKNWVLSSGKATVAAIGASLTEALLTGGNDNVVVPVILWLLTKGLSL